MEWKPGQGNARRALEDPYVGVPAHLHRPLWDWVGSGLDSARAHAIAVKLRVPLDLKWGPRTGFEELESEHPFIVLQVAEELIEAYGYDDGNGMALRDLLDLGNSAYRVRDDYSGLEERVVDGVRDLITETLKTATSSAGDHLIAAWNAAYGLPTDPPKAYSEAIKAVESALAPLVSPQNSKQTLGTMIRDIDNKSTKWTFVIADGNTSSVGTVLSMMRTLWDGQTSRHGGTLPTRAETREEARAAVHLAASLVQLGISRAFNTAP